MSSTVVDKEFRERLRLIMQQFGSVADLAQAVGVSDNAIYKWVSGRGQPSIASLINLAKAAGVSVEWLVTGRGVRAKSKAESPTRPESQSSQEPEEFVFASGMRTAVQSPQIVDYLKFKADWLARALSCERKNLVLVEAVGDSMAPMVGDGDLVLVDVREGHFRHDGLYVLRSGNTLSVKRIQRQPDGSVVVRSDNSAYQSLTLSPEDVNVFGKVRWLGRRV